MSNVVLECRNVYKKIGNREIINNLNLKLYEGDILGFIGSNGVGKTTSIKLMLGLQSVSSGMVYLNGFDIEKNFKRAIMSVGAIVENPDLYMYMSGYDHLRMASFIYGVSEERIQEVIGLVGLSNKIYDKVKKYSLGMRQRLGIALSILHHPKILILDEPMNGLDPDGIADLKRLLLFLAKKEKIAVLISSHLLSELDSICNRVCIMSNGTIVLDDSIENIRMVSGIDSYVIELSYVPDDCIYTKVDDNHIKVRIDKRELNGLISSFLENDIFIYEIRRESLSLEELFFDVTRGNSYV